MGRTFLLNLLFLHFEQIVIFSHPKPFSCYFFSTFRLNDQIQGPRKPRDAHSPATEFRYIPPISPSETFCWCAQADMIPWKLQLKNGMARWYSRPAKNFPCTFRCAFLGERLKRMTVEGKEFYKSVFLITINKVYIWIE